MHTFQDAVHHLLDYMGANQTADAVRDARRATILGRNDLVAAHRWSYLYGLGRIATNAPYSTGTIAYDHTGGTYERQVTLTSGTWPSWAANGTLRISNVNYKVDRRISDTVVTLTSDINPGADVASGTSYSLFQDYYSLPTDFLAADEVYIANETALSYVHPQFWLQDRSQFSSSGTPTSYTIIGDPKNHNRMAMAFFPHPDAAEYVDFVYHKRPRDLKWFEYKTGTVSTTADSTTITGSSTSWDSTMEGSIIRINAVANNTASGVAESGPYGFDRSTYYIHERKIVTVASATSLTVDSAIGETTSAKNYVISDPIDIEEGAMLTAFFRSIERQLAIIRRAREQYPNNLAALYQEALVLAKEADARTFSRRTAGPGLWFSRRALDIQRPLGADVS